MPDHQNIYWWHEPLHPPFYVLVGLRDSSEPSLEPNNSNPVDKHDY